jgi:hypothetical protein
MSSSDDPFQQLKDQVFNSNKKVAPKAVLVSLALNAVLSVRSTACHNAPLAIFVRQLHYLTPAFDTLVSYSACIQHLTT